jgi:cobyrinic acid a,c-diamide synthase
MLPAEVNREIYAEAAADADVAVVEGVMGLYDGVDGRRPEGSSAHLARLLDLPVVLVVDARAAARSAAALVHGFATFDTSLRFAGVIWNRVGSPSHERILDEALAHANLPPSFGAIPRDEAVTLPERHLGLTTPDDAESPQELPESLAHLADNHLDLDTLLRNTRSSVSARSPQTETRRKGLRIGVPQDAAYCFYYERNLQVLEAGGAQVVKFRPLEGDGIPPGLTGLYLGGGYPEVHAERLSQNTAFLDGVRELHECGIPIYAECGGFMTLCREVEDLAGRRHRMAGVFPTIARMNVRSFRLGYREVRVEGVSRMRGVVARGHEFHYSHIDPMPESISRVYQTTSARGETLAPEGFFLGNTLAGYIHLHFGSSPDFPLRFFGMDSPDFRGSAEVPRGRPRTRNQLGKQ